MYAQSTQILVNKFSILPEYLQNEVLLFIDKLVTLSKNTSINDNAVDIEEELKHLLINRKEFSRKNPESRVSWKEVRKEITMKYGMKTNSLD